jgi:outer membrane protein insertion porin family
MAVVKGHGYPRRRLMPGSDRPPFRSGPRPMGAALLGLVLALALALLPARNALAQSVEDESLADRPISKVTLSGLGRVGEQEIRNNLRVAAGEPYDARVVRSDVTNLYRLGHFATVTADAKILPDGTVEVTFLLVEQSIVEAIQTVGNKALSDQELREVIPLYPGGPRDDFLLQQSVFKIKELYKSKGHYLVEVSVDESQLKDQGILIFRIVEGPRVRIREIEFTGNRAFPAKQLAAQIKTKPWIFLFRKGNLDEEALIDDVATLDAYYKDRGYMDVRVDRRVELSADQKEAKVVFMVTEGRQYRLRSIRVEGSGDGKLRVFSPEQLRGLIALRPGDAYVKPRIEQSTKLVQAAYFTMGYTDARVDATYVRAGEEADVDMIVTVTEGDAFQTGLVRIQGNFITRDKVIRRLVRFQPGRPLDGNEIENTEKRLKASNLFNENRVTAQAPDPDDASKRDVLVEIKEKNTGSLNFGVSVGTDQGFGGEISLNQYNFDIADPPASFGEFFGGRSFRGAGQTFNLTIAPGIDVSTYSFSIGDPHLLETDWGGTASGFYRQRVYSQNDEERLNGQLGLGRKLGDFWSFNSNARLEWVKLTDFQTGTPIEIYNQAGPSTFTVLAAGVQRNTVDNRARPGSGSIMDLGVSQYLGDYTYPTVRAAYTTFLTLDEDFLGRKTTLRLNAQSGYLFSSSAPVFERFYLGGRTLRGFAFRGVSPQSVAVLNQQPWPATPIPLTSPFGNSPANPNAVTPVQPYWEGNPVGGQFMFFAGAQVELPVFMDAVNTVLFVDSGTVDDSVSLDQYRVSVGAGLRLYIPMMGPAPIALDFAVPVLKEEFDSTQVFSFNAELPF